jgi:4,5-DOPA dioxygenase extradiol
MPALFLSHGAPDILLSEQPAVAAFQAIAAGLPRPAAVVIVSAHWTARPVGVTTGARLPTVHDFGGFPAELYHQRYPARGDDTLSDEIREHLQRQGFEVKLDGTRGLDHGAWIPLKLIFPEADVPVVQVSLPGGGFDEVARLGEALGPLRQRGILVAGSGGSVHNLRVLNRSGRTDDWAIRFEQWLQDAVVAGDFERITSPARFPPEFALAHPTLEHFMPLVFAWAAGGRDTPGRRLHHSFSYGNLGMSCYEFGSEIEQR